MPSTNSYLDTARDFADGVRVLFAPSGVPTGERGGAGPASPDDLAAQAEKLSEVSARLTREAENKLATEKDPAAVAQASTQLLAKALTDLEISARLLNAAQEEEAKIGWVTGGPTVRSAAVRRDLEELLQIVAEEVPPAASQVARGGTTAPAKEAQLQLSQGIEGTLYLISTRASKNGQSAFAGLLGLGIGEVGKAAGTVGLGLAQALGQAEKVTWLYNLFRDFALRAYDSVVALLGPTLAQLAGKRIMEWIDEVREAKFFGSLLERLYQTKLTKESLDQLITESKAETQRFLDANQSLTQLNDGFGRQMSLIEKLLKGLQYFGSIPAAILPSGPLLVAGVYIVICGYVVFAGADYVDAPSRVLNRVSGVRQIVETNLMANGEGN